MKKVSIKEFMSEWASKDIDLCIGCNRCMEACPVSKEPFTIAELNYCTEPATIVSSKIREFAFNCVQCGRCIPVCPAGARRDYMVQYIKHKLKKTKPSEYKRYLSMKGPFLNTSSRLKQKAFTKIKKIGTRDLASFMETTPSKKTSVLFYPGCYIYNTNVIRRTLKLLDHIDASYSVLGGLTTCCGVPQLIQGEYDIADQCLDSLHEKIMKSEPEIVITGCAECLEALLRIKEKYDETFEALTVIEYLMRYIDKFPRVKIRDKVTLHDSCRISRRYTRGKSARDAISRFSNFVEMKNVKKTTMCCYYWNMEYDKANANNRTKRLNEAKEHAPTMACDCVSCFEKYGKVDKDVEVIDILQLFEEAIDTQQSKEIAK